VARELQRAGLATVLADLLTPAEEQLDTRTGRLRFDIGLLARRVTAITDWLAGHPPTAGLPAGLFGASTGAAAALVTAAARPGPVAAVVSRGGRPVGALDTAVIELNRKAMQQLSGPARLEIVAGASHLFEEPRTLEQVARLAQDWFSQHLRPEPRTGRSAATTSGS
jgi:dienelactone hydrolase